MKKIDFRSRLVAAGVAVVAASSMANAAIGDTFVVDTAPVAVVAGVILTALGIFWTARKVISMVSR